MIASYRYSKLEKRSKVIKKNIRNVFFEILFKKLAQKYSLTDVVIRNQRNRVFRAMSEKKSGENYLK